MQPTSDPKGRRFPWSSHAAIALVDTSCLSEEFLLWKPTDSFSPPAACIAPSSREEVFRSVPAFSVF